MFQARYHDLKRIKSIYVSHILEAGTFSCKMVPVSASQVQRFPSTSINPENDRKRRFLNESGPNFARGTCIPMTDIQYSRPISALSNRVDPMSLRQPVAEQSARDRGGVGRFFAVLQIVRFPC